MTAPRARFRDLTRPEVDAFLDAHHVGRIAYAFRDRVDIEPIHYVYDGGWIYGRTAPGTKLTTLQRNPWVAFEVDEVRNGLDWTSVVVKGTVYFVGEEATEHAQATYDHVLARLRTVAPFALTDADPVPERTELFRLYVHDVRGRECRPV
jgi:nitroimidazol reductase NimA-like FMN-containing flavoprotein (pyridoxamine 5'-phosphate oxidase superfamily)